MSDKLVPEMHDIGKLVDWDSIREIIAKKLGINKKNLKQIHSHSFIFWDKEKDVKIPYLKSIFGVDEPEGSTWKVINYHHDEGIPKKLKESLKGDEGLFLIRLADHMGAVVSRMLEKKEKEEFKKKNKVKKEEIQRVYVHKLWNPDKSRDAKIISDENKFVELLEFIKKYPSIKEGDEKGYERYFTKYRKELRSCPEDRSVPINVTSLLTHSLLVGKFYRFFETNKNILKTRKGKKLATYTTPEDAENNIEVLLIQGKVSFHISPVRTRDLNVFTELEKFVNAMGELDEVIFHTSDEFLAFLPPSTNLDNFFDKYLSECLWINVTGVKSVLIDAFPTPKSVKLKKINNNLINEKSFEERDGSVYKNLAEKIRTYPDHPICDLCQMYQAIKKFPQDYVYDNLCEKCKDAVKNEGYPFPLDRLCANCKNKNEKWLEEIISEDLCINCFNLRKKEPRTPKIIEWSESDEDFKVAWIKISLDIEKLQRTLEKLYEAYLSKKGSEKKREGEIRFSVLSEFQSDYNEFLKELMREDKEGDKKELKGKFVDEFENMNCQWILSDFFCIKIDNPNRIKQILGIYEDIFMRHFPKFKEHESPIKLSISCSNIKFAFFWHWKFLENPEKDINVNLVGKGEMHLNMKQLDKILDLDMEQFTSASLHKLSRVSEVSKSLSKILLYDKGDFRLYKEYDGLRRLVDGGIDFPNILTYAKMMGDKEEVAK